MLSRILFVFIAFTVNGIAYGQLLGAPQRMNEEEFDKLKLQPAIDEKFEKQSDGTNKPSYKFLKYHCGTRQLVAGMWYNIEFSACEKNQDSNCFGPKVKCNASYLLQPWLLVHGAPVDKIDISCENVTWKLCSKENFEPSIDRQKRSVEFSASLTMDKPGLDDKSLFDKFIHDYGRTYGSDPSSKVYQQRYAIFKKNLKIIQELNRLELGTAVYGITEFMDYTDVEYKKKAPGFTKQLVEIRKDDLDDLDTFNIPESVDWRKKGAVTKVKNQGSCGSCWAFSTTGNIEGQWFIKKKKLVSLSEQELVDCDSLDQGCEGGLPSNAYKSIEKLGGMETEKEYPYEGSDDHCNVKKSEFRVFINDSVALSKDEGKLAAWLAANGPISIGINANVMQFYTGGISHPWKIFCNPTNLDHGVLIVGYGTENGTPFWIIKNSWGSNWGENGYYRIYRGDGSCGVNQMATSSIVD